RVAHRQLAHLVAELDERAQRRSVGLLEVPELALGERLLADGAEAELDGLVAVDLVRADPDHRAGAGLEHGDALDTAFFGEPLGHPQLLGKDGWHGESLAEGESDLDVN